MALVDFKKTFGAGVAQAAAGNAQRPKAEFWVNIGYDSGVAEENDPTTTRFVSIPVGIPLDSQEHLPTNSSNTQFAAFRHAQNGLLDQIMAVAKALKPGETKLLGLQVQLRRVNGEGEAIAPEDNPFVKALTL